MSRIPHPTDSLTLTDSAFILNLGFFALVGFNTLHHTDGATTWGSTWAMVDLFGFRRAGFLFGSS